MPKIGIEVSSTFATRPKFEAVRTTTTRMKEVITLNRILMAIFANISGLISGYTMCSCSVAMPILKDIWKLTDSWQSYIIGILSLGAAASSLISGGLNDMFGRRPIIISSCVLIMIGDIIIMAIGKQEMLIATGRLISGFGIGLSSATVPMYVSECSPRKERGRFLVLFQLSIAFGYALAACVAGIMDVRSLGTPSLLMLNILFSIIQFVGMINMPESPRWLILRGSYDQAHKVMTWMQQSTVEAFEELCDAIRKEGYQSLDADDCTIFYIIRNSLTLRALVIGCVLQVLKQFTFMGTFFLYGSSSFLIISDSPRSSILVMAVLFGVNFLFTLLVFVVIPKFKRKTFLLLSLACFAGVTLVAGITFTNKRSKLRRYGSEPPKDYTGHRCPIASCFECTYRDDCGFCFIQNPHDEIIGQCLPTVPLVGEGSNYGNCKVGNAKPDYQWSYTNCRLSLQSTYMLLTGRILEIAAYAVGIGPLSWVINAEIYPNWARSSGAAFCTTIYWSLDAFFNMTYYSLRPPLNDEVKAYISAICCLLGALFIHATLPNTRNKRLESLDKLVKRKWNFYFFKV